MSRFRIAEKVVGSVKSPESPRRSSDHGRKSEYPLDYRKCTMTASSLPFIECHVMSKATILFGLLVLVSGPVFSADWPQWAGPDRQGQWNETGILRQFPEGGLKPTWSVPIGSGYSGPIVAGGRVFVTDYRPKANTEILEAIERVLCLDEQTGKILWTHEWETHYRRQMRSYATGPRATPLFVNGRLFTLGATGRLHCFDADTGKVLWEYDSLQTFKAEVPAFGVSASPIAWKDTVIVVCGGRDGLLRAFDQATGKQKWKAIPADYEMPYSAPQIIQVDGVTQLIQWDQTQLSALNPDTGKVIWQVPFFARSNMALARPVLIGNRLLVSGFYDGSMLVEVTANDATMLWKNGGQGERPQQTASLHAVITTPIAEGDHFYGTCSYGELRGLRLKDGERVWEQKDATRQGRWGSMFWVKNGDRYFVNNDLGELLIMQFTPEGAKILDRTQAIKPDTHCGYGPRRFADALVNWVQPAYANRHMIIRNDSEIRRISLEAKK
ncbi:MAG TPA: pyrrolo-quinoline quinone [Planctomycetaceae bacterium]|nr:pyrrolo-quinoline quinone [Planctomycetaceae bacterium]